MRVHNNVRANLQSDHSYANTGSIFFTGDRRSAKTRAIGIDRGRVFMIA